MALPPMTLSAPDGRHTVELEPTGEVCMGQALFRARVDGVRLDSQRYTLGKWLFGDVLVWSIDSRWLAIQRWDLPDRGPQTSLLVLDLGERRWKIVGPNYRSVMKPLRIDEDALDFETLAVRTGEVRTGRAPVSGPMSRWGTLDETDGLS